MTDSWAGASVIHPHEGSGGGRLGDYARPKRRVIHPHEGSGEVFQVDRGMRIAQSSIPMRGQEVVWTPQRDAYLTE